MSPNPGGVNWHERFRQQAGWTRPLREYLFEQSGMAGAHRVLEVGCGTGAILEEVKSSAQLFGLDLDYNRLKEAQGHAPQAVLTCGDALRLPYPDQAFDTSFCHFLLLWVQDPLQALLEMKRVTRTGGYVLALAEPDYTHRTDEPEELAQLGRLQTQALRRQGADPGVGGRLAQLFRQAGLQILETGRLQENPQQPMSREEWVLEWRVLEADLAGSVTENVLQRLKRLDEQARQRGQRRLSVPTHFAFGQA